MDEETFINSFVKFREILESSIEIILCKDSKYAEFNLAVNSIHTVVEYISSKRKPDER